MQLYIQSDPRGKVSILGGHNIGPYKQKWYMYMSPIRNGFRALPAHSGPSTLIQFRNHFSQTVWLLGRLISPQTHNKCIHTPNIHALSGIRTRDPSVRASEDSSCLRQRGYCDRLASELAKTVHALDSAATVTGEFQFTVSRKGNVHPLQSLTCKHSPVTSVILRTVWNSEILLHGLDKLQNFLNWK
jgi:hypothetical protein